MAEKNYGSYLWRGGEKIDLEKEEEVFTVVARDRRELERVRSVSGIEDLQRVSDQVYKVRTKETERNNVMDRVRSEDPQGIAHHAYRPARDPTTRYYLTDQIIVRFKPGVSQEEIEGILAQRKLRLVKTYADQPNTFLLQVTADTGENPIKAANRLADEESDSVLYAEPNLVNRFQLFYEPTDPYFPNQWHLRSQAGPELVADADVSATEAWDITRGSRQIVVALLDDGFDLSHPDFNGNGKVVFAKDYVDGDANPFPETGERDYHGTPCAGVAIAEENDYGVVGAAPGCAFMPVRFPLAADDNLLVEIFDHVGARADVISCSWGPPPVYAPLHQIVKDKFHQLATSGGPRKKGCVIIFAAGNYNAPLQDLENTSFTWRHPLYGILKTQGPIVNGFATHPNVIAVAASTSLNRKAAYSNWGREIAVCAPSNNFHPLDRNIHVPGRGIWTTDNEDYGLDFTPGSRFTGRFGGTSSATPLVAGVAALVLSANPELTAVEVKEILQATADKIVDPEPDPVLGLTKGDYDENGHSEWFGYGKVNAHQAMARAKELLEERTATEVVTVGVARADGALVESHDSRLFKVILGDKLRIDLAGPSGEDFDLYLKKDAPPTTSEYDARGFSASANERIVLDPAEPGEYYIMVRSHRGKGDFTLDVVLE